MMSVVGNTEQWHTERSGGSDQAIYQNRVPGDPLNGPTIRLVIQPP